GSDTVSQYVVHSTDGPNETSATGAAAIASESPATWSLRLASSTSKTAASARPANPAATKGRHSSPTATDIAAEVPAMIPPGTVGAIMAAIMAIISTICTL